jgi:serine/threonine protein kinase
MQHQLIGKTLGQYEIKEQIGRGGMATVFKAYQANLGRFVAVKVMSTSLLADPTSAERFQREAHAIAQLNHPGILPVYDFGVEEGYHYIVMRYVPDSLTLSDYIAQEPPMEQLIDYIAQVADALNFAHEQGIIHRDIKPSNVMIDGKWALLADFGLVKHQSVDSNLTGTGMGMGTPAYMSPEQARGHELDHRTDIYALGVILHKILTNTIPHNAPTPWAIIARRTMEPVTPIRQVNPKVTQSMEYVTMRALAQEPDMRYASASEFASALQKAYLDPNYKEAVTLPSLQGAETTMMSSPGEEATMPHPVPGVEPKTLKEIKPATEQPQQQRGINGIWLVVGGVVLLVVIGAFFIFGAALFGNSGNNGDPGAGTPQNSAGVVDTTAPTTTPTPANTDTPAPSPTPAPQTPQAIINQEVEVRGGPGDDYALLGLLPPNASVAVTSRDQSGEWWQIETPLGEGGTGWIRADSDDVNASNTETLPIAVAPPTLTPTPTETATEAPPTDTPPPPTNTPSPTAVPTDTPGPTAENAASAVVDTATPTVTPTPDIPSGEIELVSPNSVDTPSFGPTLFEWRWSGPLPADRGFEVRVWRDGEPPAGVHNSVLDNQDGTVQNLGNGTFRLNADITSASGVNQRSGDYNWTVLLVQIDPEYKELGVQAPPGRLRFEMPGGGGSDGGGGSGGGGGFN